MINDRFTPREMLELSRPSAGLANSEGDLALVPVSQYSFEEDKLVHSSQTALRLRLST
jgi:hypothetical protein